MASVPEYSVEVREGEVDPRADHKGPERE